MAIRRESSCGTRTKLRGVISDDVSRKDVRAIIKKVAELDDIREVKSVCYQLIHTLDTKDGEGFTRSMFKLYGEDMREIAKGTVRDVHAANDKHFVTEFDERLAKIDDILSGCSLLLEYIQICVDEHIISVKKGGIWTKKVTDVKYMSASWKKNDGGRARKIKAEAQAEADRHQYDLTKGRRERGPGPKVRVLGGGTRLVLGYDSFRPPTGGSALRIATPTTVRRTR